MRRRQLIKLAGMAATTAMAKHSNTRAQATGKFAVVVGVDRPGNLPPLTAAASGAHDMATWLRSENFEVKLLTDEASPVSAANIKAAIRDCLNPGTARQLVVYFAGHGFVNFLSEFWMLSGAPDDPNEAVNLVGSVLLARQTAVPNIVVISDACRSAPGDLGISNVQGSLIFPNRGRASPTVVAVDQFLATRVGDAAYEDKLSDSLGRFHGLFTTSFLSAFQNPPSQMVTEVDGEKVVPNRRLKKYLLSDLPKRMEERGLLLKQLPDSSVTSDDDVYIGRAHFTAQQQSAPVAFQTPEDVAARDILGLGPPNTGGGRAELSRVTDYVNAKLDLLSVRPVAAPTSRDHSTIVVMGARAINSVRVSAGLEARLPNGSDGDAVIIEVMGASNRAFSAVIRFADGSGTVIAGLPRHNATVVVREGGVASVNYTSRDSPFDTERLNGLRAGVAAAASIGAFRIPDNDAAAKFADEIRVMKGVDPTLGLFAAYAYSQAGRADQVVSVARIMQGDLEALLFDVAMLAAPAGVGPPPGAVAGDGRIITPFCPMLSQGWNLLQATGSVLPKRFPEVRQYLKQALWTTIDRKGMDILLEVQAWKL